MISTRPARPDDEGFILQMLYTAGTHKDEPQDQQELEAYLAQDVALPRYYEGWGREGDAGIVMEDDGRPVGAAWFRTFSVEAPGFGFVAPDVPEFGIGLLTAYRDLGLGRRLMNEMLSLAHVRGHERISLSVAPDNARARHLYESLGFVTVEVDDDGWSTMVLTLGAARGGTR